MGRVQSNQYVSKYVTIIYLCVCGKSAWTTLCPGHCANFFFSSLFLFLWLDVSVSYMVFYTHVHTPHHHTYVLVKKVFEEDLNTINDGQTYDVVSFEQGVWCSKSWSSAPFGTANLPAGNKIFCCQPGSHLRCSCPNYSDEAKEANATSSTTGCCPTTNY